ncbi:hypothetical protein OOK41_10290 [Micromonospora sp. NBC_01655]|uniref:hypothetical protein n=1 Tax=Micromonospora sp. NBC_01655 TaxID=2975983 RepID=UPI002251E43B|nr:hypothetical protein [Micromonospora sp. NBC_01655]MCX4470690.1 hypothetical protein [Micromonospora sp. NBC_01655]
MAWDIQISAAWDIQLGDVLVRRQLHQRVGGSWQGGITRPANSSDVLLFSSPAGARFGYDFDGWRPDGAFHYTGEGQVGDQTFVRGNAAVRDHLDRGLRLRFFGEVKRSVVRYLGEFRVDPERPWYAEEARDRLGDLRKVIVFRLLPVDAEVPELDAASAGKPMVRDVPMEAHRAEAFQVEPKREPTAAERREADLVDRYVGAVTAEGGTTTRKEIKLPDLGRALYTDLFDGGRAELVEAKSSAARHHVRLALGQLLDYARYVEHKSRAVLLPSYPGSDLVALLHSVNVACIYEQEGGGFIRLDP